MTLGMAESRGRAKGLSAGFADLAGPAKPRHIYFLKA